MLKKLYPNRFCCPFDQMKHSINLWMEKNDTAAASTSFNGQDIPLTSIFVLSVICSFYLVLILEIVKGFSFITEFKCGLHDMKRIPTPLPTIIPTIYKSRGSQPLGYVPVPRLECCSIGT